MRKRIFIALNLPENKKEELLSYREKWSDLPAKWTARDNIHITLVFIGAAMDEEIPQICEAVRKAAEKNAPLTVRINRICYGPPGKTPRMVWAVIEKSKEILELQKDVENFLASSAESPFAFEKRAYSPHITLARIRSFDFRRLDPEERPPVEEDIDINFNVDSIEIMESQLKRTGAEHTVLKSAPLLK